MVRLLTALPRRLMTRNRSTGDSVPMPSCVRSGKKTSDDGTLTAEPWRLVRRVKRKTSHRMEIVSRERA